MRRLLESLSSLSEFQSLLQHLSKKGAKCVLEQVPSGALSLLIASLKEKLGAPILYIVPNQQAGEQELRKLHTFLGEEVHTPAEEVGLCQLSSYHATFYQNFGIDPQLVANRLTALQALSSGRECVVVAALEGLLQPTLPAGSFSNSIFSLRVGQNIRLSQLIEQLHRRAYERSSIVVRPGEFSVRGGIVDFFPPTLRHPIRVEFFGDEIESIREFDTNDQCSRGEVEEIRFGLARETISSISADERARILAGLAEQKKELERRGLTREAERLEERVYLDLEQLSGGQYFEGMEQYAPFLRQLSFNALDHLPEGGLIVLSDPLRLGAEFATFRKEIEDVAERAFSEGEALKPPPAPELSWQGILSPGHRILWTVAPPGDDWGETISVSFGGSSLGTFSKRFDLLQAKVTEWIEKGGRVFLATKHTGRVTEALLEHELDYIDAQEPERGGDQAPLIILDSPIQDGFQLGEGKLVFITDKEIFGWERTLRPLSAFRVIPSTPLVSPFDLHPEDYVVHINHGIGQFAGIAPQVVEGVKNDYILIRYAEDDKLYVPITQLNRVQKYVGGDAIEPQLHRLRTATWRTTKQRIKEEAKDLAKELLELYARREIAKGFAFSSDMPWMEEMEASFEYEETEDQAQAIEDVKKDMEQLKPMDRLICGDVGFGKTEVAMRAAFKAVLDGKQVAVLAPTTVLVQQHYSTFSQRLSPYGANVEMLSRFKTRAEQESILQGLRQGRTDVVVGTHRLLQRDVTFKELGLLVIDEEQRFGVKHKERLKKLKQSVDVLILTATPIPRTMQMGLSGIRDMSLVNEPPGGRLAVKTFVMEEKDSIIREAILRELERGGQVYFVHNRVESIAHAAERVKALVPSARFRIAHGQMSERILEQVMVDFLHHKFDVLVCSTIIENGLDIANVNTLIVREADNLGLAQMYQLRGRVGRSDRQAYAYFLYRHPARLSRQALERLEAIRDLSELGSGFRLALRDLEIRGAGNLLGVEQHGHIQAVGFELYCELLEEAVREARGEVVKPKRELPSVDIPIEISLPPDYIPDEAQRLQFYRRFSSARTEEEVKALAEEMKDRYGPPPLTARNLIDIASFRSLCLRKGVAEVTVANGKLTLEGDKTLNSGPRGRLRLHVEGESGKSILGKAKQALSYLPDVE